MGGFCRKRIGLTNDALTFQATDDSGAVLTQWNLNLNFTSGLAICICNDVPTDTMNLSAKTVWSLSWTAPRLGALEPVILALLRRGRVGSSAHEKAIQFLFSIGPGHCRAWLLVCRWRDVHPCRFRYWTG